MEWSYPLLKYDFLVNLLVTLWVVKPCEQSYLNQMTKGLEVDRYARCARVLAFHSVPCGS